MILAKVTILKILVICSCSLIYGSQRPFFHIGHGVNSIRKVETFLKLGSNVLELDVPFNPDGSIHKVLHGHPCDLGRVCNETADLAEYLDYIRNLTDPCIPNGYNKQLVMLFFDLHLGASENKTRSGEDVLKHIVDNLWSSEESRQQEVKVLLYIQRVSNSDFILGFLDELYNLGLKHRFKDVGFDGGVGNRTRDMFESINARQWRNVNVWHGEGISRAIHGDKRLGRLVSVRDSPDSFMQKVYDWTVDKKWIMRRDLRLGVDGIITNKPKALADVLGELEFEGSVRLATIEDDPFALFQNGIITYELNNDWLWMLADDLGEPEFDAVFWRDIIEDDPSEDGIPTNLPKTMPRPWLRFRGSQSFKEG